MSSKQTFGKMETDKNIPNRKSKSLQEGNPHNKAASGQKKTSVVPILKDKKSETKSTVNKEGDPIAMMFM